jgi:hypothetical protein
MNPIQQAIEALSIADKFCGSLTSDVCGDEVHIPIREALTSLRSLQKEVEAVELPVAWRNSKTGQIESAAAFAQPYNWGDRSDWEPLYTAVAAALGRGSEANKSSDECPKCGSVEWDEVYQHGSVTPSCRRCAYSSCDHEWSPK